jgi:hypothetical protein
MWPTTKVGAPKQPTTERHADDSIMEATPKTVTLTVLDGSQVEVYSRKHGGEETSLLMKVYMLCMLVLTWFVMRSALV